MTLPFTLGEERVSQGISLQRGHESHTRTLRLEWGWGGCLSHRMQRN